MVTVAGLRVLITLLLLSGFPLGTHIDLRTEKGKNGPRSASRGLTAVLLYGLGRAIRYALSGK